MTIARSSSIPRGLLIESPELAERVAERFNAIATPANCYIPHLSEAEAFGIRHLLWQTVENGKLVELETEPMSASLRGIARIC